MDPNPLTYDWNSMTSKVGLADYQSKKSHLVLSFLFLPAPRRVAYQRLYAVGRTIDDAVDLGRPDVEGFLSAWCVCFSEKLAETMQPYGQRPFAEAFLRDAAGLGIPVDVLVDLIDKGVSQDLRPRRYQTA